MKNGFDARSLVGGPSYMSGSSLTIMRNEVYVLDHRVNRQR